MTSEQSAVVRTAVEADEEGIMALLRSEYAENGVDGADWDRIRNIVQRAWSKDGALIGVIGKIGEPVGLACLVVSEIPATGEPLLRDLSVYVHPDHRRSGYAKALLGYCKKVADALGIKTVIDVYGGKITDGKPDGRMKLYERMFGEPVSYSFLYSPKAAEAA